MATQQDVIKNFVASLDKTQLRGTAAVDEAIKACSSFTSYDELIKRFLADRNNSASGDDFLKRYCGINLDNEDTGAITGSDAGGSQTKTAESVVPENSGGKSIYPPSNSFSYKGLTVNVPNASTLNDAQKNIVAGLYTWWLKSSLDLIEETYGISFEDADVTLRNIDVDFNMSGYSNWDSFAHYSQSDGKLTYLQIHINSEHYKNITATDSNGKGDTDDILYLDRVIERELSRSLLHSKTNYHDELPSIIGKGLTALTDGSDDRLINELISLSEDEQKLKQLTISNSRGDTGLYSERYNDFAMGYMLLRYLAKQTVEPTNVGNTVIPADAFEYNGHLYYIYSGVASTWEAAQEYCQSLGGHLAVINDAAENTALFNYMKSSGYSSAYFGLSDAESEGSWKWIDGTSITYTNWAGGEPNNDGGNEDYAEFYYKFTDGKWNDGNFNHGTQNDKATFICEWDGMKDDTDSTDINKIGSSIIDTLKAMNDEVFQDFINKIKNVANGITKLEDFDIPSIGSKPFKISAIIGDTIEYLQDLQHFIVHHSDTGLSASANFEKLSSSSIKEFASIYDLLNEFSTATDTSIWGSTAEKNVQVLTLAADLLSVRASVTNVSAEYEEKGIKAAILSCGDVFKNFGTFAKDLYKSKVTNPAKKGPWNAVDFYAALVNSAWGIFEQSYKSHQKYYADGKWSLDDTARFLMDVSISGLYGITHTLFEENDDLFWDVILGNAYRDGDMTYPERLSAALSDCCENIGIAIRQFGSNVVSGLSDMWNQLKYFQFSIGVGVAINTGKFIFKLLSKPSSKSVTYIDENGEVLSSSKNAVASITMANGKATLKTLKNAQQELSLGSEKDTMEWSITTKDGDDNITINSVKNMTIKSGKGNDSIIVKSSGNAYINAEKGNDKVSGGSGNDKIWGGDGNDVIYGGEGNDTIKGDAGSDILYGGAGNDDLTGGKGADIFVYESGNDIITDYKAGEDKIQLSDCSIISSAVIGSNLNIKTDKGTITIKSGKNKQITVIDKNGNETTNVYPILPTGLSYDKSKKVLTVGTSYSGTAINLADYATTTKTVDASALTKKITITGNDKGNTLIGGTKADKLIGGSKVDTLTGGKGNDVLTGGGGKDVFVYASGDGKDTITDYSSGDRIKISSGNISGYNFNGKDVVFKIGSGSITVKNGKGKKITITDANNKTTTKTYTNLSSSADLFEDDNFISSTARIEDISEITANNYSVTQIQSANYETLAQDNKFIATFNSHETK